MAVLTNTDKMYLKELQKKMGTNVAIGESDDFRKKIFEMSTQTRYLVELNATNPIKKGDMHSALPDKEKCILYRCGYIKNRRERILVGLIIWTNSKNGTKAKDGQRWKKVKYQLGSYTAFFISANKVKIFGNKRSLLGSMRKHLSGHVLFSERPTYDNSAGQILNKLLALPKTFSDIEIYEVQFETDEGGKKTRMRAYADSGDLVEKFIDRNLPSQNRLIRNFLDLRFKDSEDRKAMLKISTIGNNQLLRWKMPYNDLTRRISENIGIRETECLISSAHTDSEKIDEFFREDYISDIKKNAIYNDILREYGNYLYIDDQHAPKIKVDAVAETLRSMFSEGVEDLSLVQDAGIFFPVENDGEEARVYPFVRIKKDGKIAQNVLLDHEMPYKIGEVELVRNFLPLVPFYTLDFRKSPKDEVRDKTAQNSLLISSGEFIFNLKNHPEKVKERLLEKSNSVLTPEERAFHFEAACKALSRLGAINKKLGSASQRKGALFEGLVLCVLIGLFPTKKIGGSRKADGKFLFDDERVLYDAKNLKKGKHSLWNSVERGGLPKDVQYILDEQVDEYVFIVNDVRESDFNRVKTKIEQEVRNRGRNCRVSCVTLKALKQIASISRKNNISVNRDALKRVILSGNLTRIVNENDIVSRLD